MPPSSPARTVRVSLEMMVRSLPFAGPGELSCPACDRPLDLHQPDPESPHRLVGTCSCTDEGTWTLVTLSGTGAECYLIRLPGLDRLRAATET